MRKVFLALAGVALAISASACAPTGDTNPNPTDGQVQPTLPAIDPSLIPTAAPASVIDVDPNLFLTQYGDYLFRVGQGPTWCSISPEFGYAICEQNEVAAQYATIPVPATCDYSYGFQVRLWGVKPEAGQAAEFPCSGGAFADPNGAATLEDGQRITVAPYDCWVQGDTARCENETGDYVVLGPKAWALGNS
mgnify:CR=1 FL=1